VSSMAQAVLLREKLSRSPFYCTTNPAVSVEPMFVGGTFQPSPDEKGSQFGLPVGKEPTGRTRSEAEMGPASSLRGPGGIAATWFTTAVTTLLRRNGSPQMLGRVMALFGVAFIGTRPIGATVVGYRAEHVNVGRHSLQPASGYSPVDCCCCVPTQNRRASVGFLTLEGWT
jgi:hypothetical protein